MSSKFFEGSNVAAQNQLVKWINDAGMAEGNRKADLIRKISEILIHQVPQMIPTYMDNILSYCSNKSTEVKKQVVTFIEEISKTHPEHLSKVVGQLRIMLSDSVIAVQKRTIQASSIVYRNALLWICDDNAEEDDLEYVWQQLSDLKLFILNMIDSDNEGIRTHSIKFLEEVVLLQTATEDVSSDEEFSLNRLPTNLLFIKRDAIEKESEHIFMLLVKFHNSQHISSVNLMACMTTLCLLAKFRPRYMPRVIQALGDLHTTLPPTLSQSQVNSVRKHLKMLLINLIKHPSSNDAIPQLTQLLLDIGMTVQEVNKIVPKERRNKRVGEIKHSETPSKKIRLDSPQSNSQGSDSNSRSDFNIQEDSNDSDKQNVTEDSLLEGLNKVDNVVSIVMHTLENSLPDDMPSNFTSIYTPIPNAGTNTQKKALAKMILVLVKGEDTVKTMVDPVPITQPVPTIEPPVIQPKLSEIAAKIPLLRDDDEKLTLKNAVAKLQETTAKDILIETAVTKLMEEKRQEFLKADEKTNEKLTPPQTPSIPKLKQRVKLLKLHELTRPLPNNIRDKLLKQSVTRILNAEKDAEIGGAATIRAKLITTFASSYTPELRELVLNYILEDAPNRIDLALSWLYEEYAFMQGFSRHPVTLQAKSHEKHDQNYNQLLCALVTQISELGDPSTDNAKDVLLRKIYSEAPLITEEAIDYLRHLVTEDKMTLLALELLEEVCIMRPPKAHKYITALLAHAINENEEIRETALKSVIKIYKTKLEPVKKVVEKFALLYLGFISLSNPPMDLFGENSRYKHNWSDDLYKLCLNLIMAVFIENEEIILEIARVYGEANSDAKRCVLRAIEAAIKQLGCENPLRPAIVLLLDECPRGAETMITKLVHVMTEKAPPPPELVSRVRELYATRVADVRFLIPVLNGLTKKEILAALPKLIKLNPVVVKEVFNKLLGLQNPDEETPVTPSELLVALHLIDPNKADLKYIIKATALCFAEKQVYTQDVVSSVLQRLSECPSPPVLMMRSVLQALTLYAPLAGLVLNILQNLIEKEVWNNKVAWEGWVKCCERTSPASVTVMMTLPAAALRSALSSPVLQSSLSSHIKSLSPQQRALLPPHVVPELSALTHTEFQGGEQFPQGGINPLEPLPPGME